VVSDQHLGIVIGKYVNATTLKSMKMIDKVDKLDSDLKEENPVVLVEFMTRHYKETGEIINLNSIPATIGGAPLRIARKRKSKKASSEAVDDAEPKAKKPKKAKTAPQLNVVESTLSSIQEEVADLEPVKVLDKRTRGGTTVGSLKATSSKPKQKVQKKRRHVRKMTVSDYVSQEDAEVEARIDLVSRIERRKKKEGQC